MSTQPISGRDPNDERAEEVKDPTGVPPVAPPDEEASEALRNFRRRNRERKRQIVRSFVSGAAFAAGKEGFELAKQFIEHMTQN
ncbi:hypothetical protein [Mycolicibacterium mageritense]|uniref:Uncharacterized protein n=1 Tax=Mycolicibacterium mageritense TaxID=53462 RepID=A0AAI8U2D4_MYCME|nr:hypothetical protein [Mycolicibacterium mageritense]BDY33173.1 hypothetical protein hbim_07148 [Mycolicibacterium mageritense]